MSNRDAHQLDAALQEGNIWVKAVADELGLDDRHAAYVALRAVLHALRDRMGPENAVHLGAQLPMLVRGVFYEGWRPAAPSRKERHRDEFLADVGRELAGAVDSELAARAVFSVIYQKIDLGGTLKTVRVLARDLRELWPSAAQGG